MGSIQISAKTDYAIRALLILADSAPALVKVETLSHRQGLPRKFVESILSELRRAGLVHSRRGAEGGYALAKPATEITIGQVMAIVDGPVEGVGGPHETVAVGVAQHLPEVWTAMRSAVRGVLDETTLEQVLKGDLPHLAHNSGSDDAPQSVG